LIVAKTCHLKSFIMICSNGNTYRTRSALESDLNPIRSQLDIRGRVLLAVAFVRDKARRNFELFPEIIGADCTSQTKKEHRPLFLVVGKDNNGKSFVALRAILPSEKAWAFTWLWETAIPTLLGFSNVANIRLMITDGDRLLYAPLVETSANTIYKRARHSLCLYHLVCQGLNKLHFTNGGRGNENIKIALEVFKNWLFSFMCFGGVETMEEFKTSLNALNKWLKEGEEMTHPDMICANASFLHDFFKKSILPLKERWLVVLRSKDRHFGECTTSAAESQNAAAKRTGANTLCPNLSLRTSAKAMM